MSKAIFLVGPERRILHTFEPLWREARLEARRFVSAESFLEELRSGGGNPQGVMVSYPLWDATLRDLLQGISGGESNSHLLPTFVVAPANELRELVQYEDAGVSVLSEEDEPEELLSRVRERLLPSQRAGQRVVVRMEVHLGSGRLLRLCQCENLSVSGMLIRTSEMYPVGSTMEFEFVLPGEAEPVSGEAQVVRHSHPEVEDLRGVGVRFVAMDEEGKERIKRFIG